MNVDAQLLESVQRALEQDGLLQSMKAKLRSNVARIMKEAGEYQLYQPPELREMNSPDGKVLLLIVKEVLTKFNLRESLLVFEAEANLAVSTRAH